MRPTADGWRLVGMVDLGKRCSALRVTLTALVLSVHAPLHSASVVADDAAALDEGVATVRPGLAEPTRARRTLDSKKRACLSLW